jgi:hypothetical protein
MKHCSGSVRAELVRTVGTHVQAGFRIGIRELVRTKVRTANAYFQSANIAMKEAIRPSYSPESARVSGQKNMQNAAIASPSRHRKYQHIPTSQALRGTNRIDQQLAGN